MGVVTAALATVAVISGGSQIMGYREQRKGRKEAAQQNAYAREENEKSVAEQRASNASRASLERRQQIREERVARGKLMQSAINTGTSESSGEGGAQAGLAAQLGANIGFNLGQIQSANNISMFNQNAANFQAGAQQALSDAQGKANMWQLVGNLATSYGNGTK